MKCIMACIPREVGVARRVVCEETARSTRLWGAGPLFFFTLSLSLSWGWRGIHAVIHLIIHSPPSFRPFYAPFSPLSFYPRFLVSWLAYKRRERVSPFFRPALLFRPCKPYATCKSHATGPIRTTPCAAPRPVVCCDISRASRPARREEVS